MSTIAHRRMTVAEYVAFEETSEIRHEFYDGEIFAMSGASPDHTFVKENLSVAIGTQLKGKPCRSASSDMRVRVEATGFYTYPDVLIVCGERKFSEGDPYSLLNPSVVFEILSPSTEKHDRTFKLDHYRQIESLQQYALVAQDEMRIEIYTRGEVGWIYTSYTEPAQVVTLAVGDVQLPIADVYDGIKFPNVEPPVTEA